MSPTVYGEALAKRVQAALQEFQTAGQHYSEYAEIHRDVQNISVFSMDISYKRLAAFISLNEYLELNRAADAISITRGAVYNSVRDLEELLEISLFERTPTGVIPTDFSKVLARHFKLAFAQLRYAIDDIANIGGFSQGHIVIGDLPYSRTMITPRAINSLLEKFPYLQVETREGSYETLEASLRSGELDFIVGALRPPEKTSELITESLLEDSLCIIARHGHPLSKRDTIPLSELKTLSWVLPSKETPSRKLFDEILSHHGVEEPIHSITSSSLSTLRGILIESDRVSLLSRHQIYYEEKYKLLTVLPVNLSGTRRMIGITRHAHTMLSPAAQSLFDEFKQVSAEIEQAES